MKRLIKRGATDMPGLHAMRTLHSTGRRSIPRGNQSSTFIDLYMLGKEKERLEKESSILARRETIIQRRVKEIEKETGKLKEHEADKLAEGGRMLRKSIPWGSGITPRDWKKMALHY